MSITRDSLQQWLGKQEMVTDVITPTPYAALSALFDRDAVRPPAGTPLPALWHWLYFLPLVGQSEIGPDGHAKRGGFLPPVPLPRRMWAGSQLEFHRPLRIGDNVTRVSTIESVSEKTGRSGPLVFVKVRHEIRRNDERGVALTEFHDIVYREVTSGGAAPPQRAPERSTWSTDWTLDDVLLFRYSALTFNGHRIHYDRRYATEEEGYPGLVVHGPLIATMLLDLLRAHKAESRITRFQFKAVSPLFDIHPFTVCADPVADGNSFHLWARNHQGALAMDATAVIE